MPHRTNNYFTIHIPGGNEEALYEYKLVDPSGKILRTGKIDQPQNYQVDMKNYPAGLYFLVILHSGGNTTYKVIRQ